ncbi:hypothetical protein QQ045_018604 [Rhodiola kirilowii]
MTFPSDEAAYDFYYRYGVHCRFDIRRGPTHKYSDGTVLKRYVYCNKQGFVLNKSFDNENGRRKKGVGTAHRQDAGALSRIFWVDSISQLNFHAFGEVVTFDATYSLNRYNMIFVPFTGIDNHKKSVTFADALLSSEDVESYTWILECFKKCMGHAPQIVLTDQDPALRVVVPKVIPDAHHRYCIWHIMKKLSVKVGFNTPELQQFREKLKTIVYDYHVETTEFEKNWNDIISKYGLGKNKWLSSMFKIRKFWIPSYFRDISLSGLLRMTSRSESENSFFGSYLNQRMTLVAFLWVLMLPLKTNVTFGRRVTMKPGAKYLAGAPLY